MFEIKILSIEIIFISLYKYLYQYKHFKLPLTYVILRFYHIQQYPFDSKKTSRIIIKNCLRHFKENFKIIPRFTKIERILECVVWLKINFSYFYFDLYFIQLLSKYIKWKLFKRNSFKVSTKIFYATMKHIITLKITPLK